MQMKENANLTLTTVPTPTNEYRARRKLRRFTQSPGTPQGVTAAPIPIPLPLPGSRVVIYKQDPSVAEIGLRKVYLPSAVFAGPRDARIANGAPGIPAVSPNAFGDFIQTPGTPAFDAVQAYAVVRMTLTMYQRALVSGGAAATLPWQWNSSANTDPLTVFPHGLPDTMNAFYQRSAKALKFGDFVKPGSTPPQRIFTCQSLDIVAHETGHAVLDGLRPNWILANNPPQTGGLHESFGDITAIFLALSELDQVEAVIAQTKANLHDKTFLSDLAEDFGLALGRPNGLRNADNDLKLSEVGTEVHAISQVFTGAIYDILADIFSFERRPAIRDDAKTLYDIAQYLLSLLIRAIKAAPANGATFADVANQMLVIANADGKPVQYRNFIRNRFSVREVVVSATPLTADMGADARFAPGITDAPGAVQNRRGCCGTMQHPEYSEDDGLQAEIDAFKKSLSAAVMPHREGQAA